MMSDTAPPPEHPVTETKDELTAAVDDAVTPEPPAEDTPEPPASDNRPPYVDEILEKITAIGDKLEASAPNPTAPETPESPQLADAEHLADETPVKQPWTARGFRRKG